MKILEKKRKEGWKGVESGTEIGSGAESKGWGQRVGALLKGAGRVGFGEGAEKKD